MENTNVYYYFLLELTPLIAKEYSVIWNHCWYATNK